jgi:hypothetical protein
MRIDYPFPVFHLILNNLEPRLLFHLSS